jgi:glucosamine 6-phosphate synthetase-like amidotransferase/phosphosugar isomerase protein
MQTLSNQSAIKLMHEEIFAVPEVIENLATHINEEAEVFSNKGLDRYRRLCIVAHGANLYAAKIMERSLARRGIGARFADPRNAILLEDELLICITRSAANDSIMRFLQQAKPDQSVLITANPSSEYIPSGVHVIDLHLKHQKQASVATQSIFAIVMVLDLYFAAQRRQEYLDLWGVLADKLRRDMDELYERTQRLSQIGARSQRLFLVGSKTMESVAASIAWTIMETTTLPCNVIPLSAGLKGPAHRFNENDCALLLGRESEPGSFNVYRKHAGYAISLSAPAYAKELGIALYTLLQGQLLALAIRGARGT